MKIQTNAGEQELTAEMVRKGMVFRWGRTTFTIADPDQDWITAEERVCGRDLPQRADRFLGCDPTIASRADCERFGVHGDSGAHGFARLRSGGAVDFRRENLPLGAIVHNHPNWRHAVMIAEHGPRPLLEGESFIGLDPRHARPEDVRRLCCGADHPDIGGFVASCSLAIGPHDEHEDLATGVKWSAKRGCPECPAGEGQRCAADCPRVARYKATRCGARPERGQVLDRGNYDLGFHIATGEESCARDKDCDGCHVAAVDFQNLAWSGPPVFFPCPICTAKVMPDATGLTFGFAVWDPKKDAPRGAPICETCHKVQSGNSAPLRWEGDRLVPDSPRLVACPNCGGDDATCRGSLAGLKACAAKGAQIGRAPAAIEWRHGSATLGQSQAHVLRDGEVYRWQVTHLGLRIRDGAASHTFDAHDVAGRFLFAVHDATAGIEWLARMFGLLFRVHDATPAAKRAKQEAPLVALVNAVPEGLDPIGWRAAVLAVDEAHPESDRQRRLRADKRISDPSGQWLAANVNKPCDLPDWSVNRIMHDAYHRAISTAPKVERVRITWKTRGPALAIDNGEDE